MAVIGNTGSGKTTFAQALARRLGVPHVELDALHWQSGWVMTPTEDVQARVAEVLAGEGWVIDGNYGATLGTTVLEQSDRVVWLDPPFAVTFWRLLRRTARRIHSRESLWETTNIETFRGAFLSRDSILWYLLKTYRHRRRRCAELADAYAHVRLRSKREVERFLETAE